MSSIRDSDIKDISFTDANGRTYLIKDMKDYTALNYQQWFIYNLKQGEDLDAIAARNDVYREGAESNFYKILEYNAQALCNVNFDITKLKTINIPI
jgi:hypothetical protein